MLLVYPLTSLCLVALGGPQHPQKHTPLETCSHSVRWAMQHSIPWRWSRMQLYHAKWICPGESKMKIQKLHSIKIRYAVQFAFNLILGSGRLVCLRCLCLDHCLCFCHSLCFCCCLYFGTCLNLSACHGALGLCLGVCFGTCLASAWLAGRLVFCFWGCTSLGFKLARFGLGCLLCLCWPFCFWLGDGAKLCRAHIEYIMPQHVNLMRGIHSIIRGIHNVLRLLNLIRRRQSIQRLPTTIIAGIDKVLRLPNLIRRSHSIQRLPTTIIAGIDKVLRLPNLIRRSHSIQRLPTTIIRGIDKVLRLPNLMWRSHIQRRSGIDKVLHSKSKQT